MPELVLIAALATKDRLIGDGLKLPWHLPDDLRRFKRLTLGHPLLMGRRTFDSLIHQFGRPLAGRPHVVLTQDVPAGLRIARLFPEVEVAGSLEDALDLPVCRTAERVFVGGGASIYALTLPVADRLELTLVDGDYVGDTYFPPYEHLIGPVFDFVAEEPHEGFRFVTYQRART